MPLAVTGLTDQQYSTVQTWLAQGAKVDQNAIKPTAVEAAQIDGTHVDPRGGYAYLGYGKGGKHWERDLEARYVVQSGAAKGTIMSLRHNVHRGNTAQAELDTDQIRLAVEYPLTGRF